MISCPPQAAVISANEKYRYFLSRSWIGGSGAIAFVGLNPSIADASIDDPTIRRCVAFAKNWGADSLWMVNLFALRSPDPSALKTDADPIGEENDYWLRETVSKAQMVIAAWGNHGRLLGRATSFMQNLERDVYALRITKSGAPSHPLYIPAVTKPIPFSLNACITPK